MAKMWAGRTAGMTDSLAEFLIRFKQIHYDFYRDSEYLFPADNSVGVISNNVVYKFYSRMCKNLGISISRELIKGTHSFRRNAITDVVHASGGNLVLASQLFGNSPEVAKNSYYTGTNLDQS